MKIAIADIVTCFAAVTVGTKVIAEKAFMKVLEKAISEFQIPENGQCFIGLPCFDLVTSGVACKKSMKLDDYIHREHRGEVLSFAKRSCAAPCESLVAFVYTVEAYIDDPRVSDEEAKRVADSDYVLVCVLASAGAGCTPSIHRFVRNLAGGNSAYANLTADEIREAAVEVVEYDNYWITVAD